MEQASKDLVSRQPRLRAASVASEVGRTLLTQALIAILLALLWALLGLQ